MAPSATLMPPPSIRSRQQLCALMRRGCSYVGELAELSYDEFLDLVARHGGTYVPYSNHGPIPLLVIGSVGLPVTPAGEPIEFAGRTCMGELEFLQLLGEHTTQ